MTTKKEKRERGERRAQERLQETLESNRQALEADRKHRENRRRDAAREKHDKQHSWKKIDHDCILCQDNLRKEREAQWELEGSSSA